VEAGDLRKFEINPADFDLAAATPSDLLGGDAVANAQILLSIFDGSDCGPKRQAVQLNAAAALTVAGLASTIADGWTLAGNAIDSGRALNSLEQLRSATH
jgi:anthranilate phosphoribosyltransferase